MSSITNLEDLSNDEIRVKLLEYGFANLPVTQTTRKVLVKKLKNAMETQKTKNRRDIVAVIKSSDEEDIPETKKREKTPRRATIAVTEKTKKAPASSSSSESIPRAETPSKTTNSRRSSRATPAKDQKPVVSSTASIINEESDDDIVEVRTYTRRSKTPTISKSETVRTSYKNETIAEPIIEKKRSVEQIAEPVIQKTATIRRKTFTTASEQFELPPRTETPTKFGKSTLTTSYNPSGNYRAENDQDYELDEKETPYLSNFAKRLSTLKAEPLSAGYVKPSYNDFKTSDNKYSAEGNYTSRYSSQYGSSSYPQAQRQQGVVSQLAKDFNKMDRQYNVRKYAFIVLLIMLIIFIYVILFL